MAEIRALCRELARALLSSLSPSDTSRTNASPSLSTTSVNVAPTPPLSLSLTCVASSSQTLVTLQANQPRAPSLSPSATPTPVDPPTPSPALTNDDDNGCSPMFFLANDVNRAFAEVDTTLNTFQRLSALPIKPLPCPLSTFNDNNGEDTPQYSFLRADVRNTFATVDATLDQLKDLPSLHIPTSTFTVTNNNNDDNEDGKTQSHKQAHSSFPAVPPTADLPTPSPTTTSTNCGRTSHERLIHYVCDMLLCMDENTIEALQATNIPCFQLLINTDPSFFMAQGIINDMETSFWTLLQKIATVKGWKTADDVATFTEEDWNATIPEQIKQQYTALLHTPKQSSNNLHVRFKNATTCIDGTVIAEPSHEASNNIPNNNGNDDTVNGKHHNSDSKADDNINNNKDNNSRCSYTDKEGQHHDSDSASGANSNNEINTGACYDTYEHGYTSGFDTGAVYATGYSDGHADGQDAMVVLDAKPNCDWENDNGTYNNTDW